MDKFANLLESVIFSPSKNKKILLLIRFLKQTSDPDRGYAIAALTGKLNFEYIKSNDLKNLVKNRVDPYLFDLSYEYVGDMAETISLIWPGRKKGRLPSIEEFVCFISSNEKQKGLTYLSDILDKSNQTERWSIIKLLTGGLRIGLSEKNTKIALSKYGNKEIERIEKIWHGLHPPYLNLFAWLDGIKQEPKIDNLKIFHPMMLSNPIEEKKDFAKMEADNYVAEWKWDGIRVQVILDNGKTTIFSRNGDNISHSFPDLCFNSKVNIVLDGELLVGKDCKPASFNELQQRLNRKKVSKKYTELYPAFIKLYDILFYNKKDMRNSPLIERRNVLERWYQSNAQKKLDLSEFIKFTNWKEIRQIKHNFTELREGYEGLMLKKKTSFYISGRPKGLWFKWKRNPKHVDAILMYAQRGHGKRSSYYSDFTFGVWNNGKLVPIGKAYTGFTNEELNKLDKFVRTNTINRYGPVREVKKEIVFEVAFDSVTTSKRHKSGIALRFPRISRIRWDKPTNEVQNLDEILNRIRIKN